MQQSRRVINKVRAATGLVPLYLGVFLNAIVTVVSIPVMVQSAGIEAWASIAIGQTVGGVIAPIVGFGWAITGPAAVARASIVDRGRIYRESMRLRLIAVLPLLGVGTVVADSIASEGDLLTALVGVTSGALVAIDASYYFLGTGQLWSVFTLTILPRTIATALGIVYVYNSGAGAIWVPIATVLGTVAGLIFTNVRLLISSPKGPGQPRGLLTILRQQWLPVISGLTGGIFLIIPTAIVGGLASNELPAFVLYDRLTKQALTLAGPIVNHFQGWVPRGGSAREIRQRMRTAFNATLSIGVIIVIGFVVMSPLAIQVLSAGQLTVPFITGLFMGAIVSLSLYESLVAKVALIIANQVGKMTQITVLGIAIGVLFVVLFTLQYGATGALAGVMVGILSRGLLGTVLYRLSSVS